MPPTSDVMVALDANTSDAVSLESGPNFTGKNPIWSNCQGKKIWVTEKEKKKSNLGLSGLECERSSIEFFFWLEQFHFWEFACWRIITPAFKFGILCHFNLASHPLFSSLLVPLDIFAPA